MVNGVIGQLDVVRHVVVEHGVSLDSVAILNLHVVVNNVQAQAFTFSQDYAISKSVVLVRTRILWHRFSQLLHHGRWFG